MATITRKQREIAQRQTDILRVARDQLFQDGYHGLSMERIAAALDYAKGTIYNHFPCKEEIMIALANEALEKRTQMFREAATWQGVSRERLAAIGAGAELFVRRYPHHFCVEQLVRSHSIWDKISEKRRNIMHMCEVRCMEIVGGIVRDAVAADDLVLLPGMSVEDVVFGLWSMTNGAYSIIATSESLGELGIGEPYAAVRHHLNALLDGLGWRPLSSEHDFAPLFDKIQHEVFPDAIAD